MNLNSGGSVKRPSGRPAGERAGTAPRAITMKASDTMKWCRPTRVTKKPIAAPMPAQAAIAMRRGDPGIDPVEEQPAGDHHREGDDRADRQVDAARDQQDRHADDDDAFDREGHRHRPHVLPGQEVGRGEGHHDEQQQDDQDRARSRACARAAPSTLPPRCVAAPVAREPLRRLGHIERLRSRRGMALRAR